MKICIFISPCLDVPIKAYGGLEQIAYLLAKGLASKHEVTVVASKRSEVEGCNVIKTVEASYNAHLREREQWEMVKDKLKWDSFDVIDFHWHSPPLLKQANVVWSIHDLLPPFPTYNFKLVARSKFHADYLSKKWGWEATYCYNGIDLEDYVYNEDKWGYILYFSRIYKGKGCVTFAQLSKKHGFKAIIAGDDRLEHGANMYDLVRTYMYLTPNCKYLGEVDKKTKLKLLSEAKLLALPLQPPYYAVFDLVIVEALASGTPVLTTDQGAPLELIGDYKTEWGCVAKNLDEFERLLLAFLGREITFSYKKCRKRAELFDVGRMVKRYKEIYKTL